jgi:L-lactate dehydrogenase complex protein LldG
VKEALAPLPHRTEYPQWDDQLALGRQAREDGELWDKFSRNLRGFNGTPLDNWALLKELLEKEKLTTGYCDPQLRELVSGEISGLTLETTFDRSRLDDYGFGITRASGAIAESGTIILTDAETSDRLGGLAPWVHIVLLNPANLYPDVPTAIQHFGDDPSIVWATGPSKTADVEGILIEGVHGPGMQVVLRDDRVSASKY